ncbi:MAG: A24 family peptidase, partial [Planctomycetota bacterium]
ASLMLWKGWMPRSFADYEEWEKGAREEAERERAETEKNPATDGAPAPSASSSAMRGLLFAGPGVAAMFFGMTIGLRTGGNDWAFFGGVGLVVGLLIGLALRRVVPASSDAHPPSASGEGEDDFLWTMYPHARREMMKEVLFLLPAALLGALGWWLCDAGPLSAAVGDAPLWLRALGGSVLGLLVGGGVVWGVRIFGSIAFNKEAMGLGDVHLMAGVGAVFGWIDPTLAFFLAPFTGILWVVLSVMSRAVFNRAGAHLPYGPQLALMTVVVVLAKPWMERGLGAIMGEAVHLP